MPGNVMENYRAMERAAREAVAQKLAAAKVRVQVGSATCENAAGAEEVLKEFRRLLIASGRKDVQVAITGCTGRCSREPIVTVLTGNRTPAKYQHVDKAKAAAIWQSHVMEGKLLADALLDTEDAGRPRLQLLFCGQELCGRKTDNDVKRRFEAKLRQAGLGPEQAEVFDANCFGLCDPRDIGKVAHLLVRPGNVVYRLETDADMDEVIREHLQGGRVVERLRSKARSFAQRFVEFYGDVAFFSRQSRVALRNCGIINPESLDEYIHFDGFGALAGVLDRNDPQWVIDELLRSKLRGRGGAGYPTGRKWADALGQPADERYIICNADEGDPGAFMDRDMLESDPFSVLEGMIIGGFVLSGSAGAAGVSPAVCPTKGFFYIRAEYPMAVRRVEKAIQECRKRGLLGEHILGSGFSFDCEVRLGAGAFVCGEETALIASIEGKRGWPRLRPPYPSQEGLWGKPTVINNVETFANVPVILDYGADWFAQLGTDKSGGTKVFALAGKVKHTGLVEVPMGTTLREIVETIGGGAPDGRQVKAIQTGGPAGGTIPFAMADTIVDFDTLAAAGSIMGSGGMIVMDEEDCMVDIARFFMAFSQDESCGECTPCREGTKRMLEILQRIAAGQGEMSDLTKLERLGKLLRKASLCGLGRAAPNPVLSTLRHYRHEYEMHIRDKRCPTGRCAMNPASPRAIEGTVQA